MTMIIVAVDGDGGAIVGTPGPRLNGITVCRRVDAVLRSGASLAVVDAGGWVAILTAGMTPATATVPVTTVSTSVAATAAVTVTLGTVVLMGKVSVRPWQAPRPRS